MCCQFVAIPSLVYASADADCYCIQIGVEQVCIGVQSHLRALMAKHALNRFYIGSAADRYGCHRMPQIMTGEVGAAGSVEGLPVPSVLSDGLFAYPAAVLIGENQILRAFPPGSRP